jgi:hypothetical protein
MKGLWASMVKKQENGKTMYEEEIVNRGLS